MQNNVPFKSILLVGIQVTASAFIVFTGPVLPSSSTMLLLLAAGVALGLWAIAAVRPRHLRITPDVAPKAELIMTGPFRLIRHPMYAALLLAMLALTLDYLTFQRICAWLILFLDILFKLSYEEKLLSLRFEAYESYRRRTKRLIPFVL